jgi:hypothetical protein
MRLTYEQIVYFQNIICPYIRAPTERRGECALTNRRCKRFLDDYVSCLEYQKLWKPKHLNT